MNWLGVEMKFLLVNAYSSCNKGDFGIRIGLINSLRKEFGEFIQIGVLSSTPEIDSICYERYNVNIIGWQIIKNFKSSRLEKIFRSLVISAKLFVLAIIYRATGYYGRNALLFSYIEADIIISPGGGFINDKSLFSIFLPNIYQIFIAIILGKNYVIYAQSIGPFYNKASAFLTKTILNKALMISVREEISKEWLTRIGVNSAPIYITSDAAFLLEPASDDIIDNIFLNEGLPRENIVGVTPVNWSFPKSKNKRQKYDKYTEALAETIDYIASKGFNILLISQVTDIRSIGENGDKITLNDIRKRIKTKRKVYVLKGDYFPEELVGIYRRLELLIGSRMHSNIFALSVGTPCIAIAYEHKTEGIMRKFGLGGWVISIEDIKSIDVINKFDEFLMNKGELKMIINKELRTIKNESLQNALILKKYMELI